MSDPIFPKARESCLLFIDRDLVRITCNPNVRSDLSKARDLVRIVLNPNVRSEPKDLYY